MEKEYRVVGTSETPEILLDPTKGVFSLSGKSMPENPLAFYAELLKKLESYKSNPQPTTRAMIEVDYFNSGSVKQIFKILCVMEELVEMGKEVEIEWRYKKGDELMLAKGLEFSNFLDISLELKEV